MILPFMCAAAGASLVEEAPPALISEGSPETNTAVTDQMNVLTELMQVPPPPVAVMPEGPEEPVKTTEPDSSLVVFLAPAESASFSDIARDITRRNEQATASITRIADEWSAYFAANRIVPAGTGIYDALDRASLVLAKAADLQQAASDQSAQKAALANELQAAYVAALEALAAEYPDYVELQRTASGAVRGAAMKPAPLPDAIVADAARRKLQQIQGAESSARLDMLGIVPGAMSISDQAGTWATELVRRFPAKDVLESISDRFRAFQLNYRDLFEKMKKGPIVQMNVATFAALESERTRLTMLYRFLSAGDPNSENFVAAVPGSDLEVAEYLNEAAATVEQAYATAAADAGREVPDWKFNQRDTVMDWSVESAHWDGAVSRALMDPGLTQNQRQAILAYGRQESVSQYSYQISLLLTQYFANVA